MAMTFRIKRRAAGGAVGAPASLASAELAYNNQDGKFYAGFGDNGSGIATSIKAFAKDDFIANVPAGGTTGQALVKLSNADGDFGWGAGGGGGGTTTNSVTFNNGGSGDASGVAFNGSVARTISYNTIGALPAASPTVSSGKLTTVASVVGAASFNLPHGTAPTSPVDGDQWTTTGGMFARINGATKQQAFLDSNITGSAASLTTGRTIGISGDGITGTGVSFNGTANITISASIDNAAVTLAKMANLAANSFIGNNTGSAATPVALTTAQAKTLLAIAFTDISGTVAEAQLASLDSAKLTGTIDPARLPASVFQAPIVSSGAISDLTAPQQSAIVAGSIVVTTDGRFWIYNTGSKTSEASYVEMADKTPEWSIIANKPSFATVATSGAYNDLSGRPTLGTMAAQNASAVAITGGTIDNIILDGGTF